MWLVEKLEEIEYSIVMRLVVFLIRVYSCLKCKHTFSEEWP